MDGGFCVSRSGVMVRLRMWDWGMVSSQTVPRIPVMGVADGGGAEFGSGSVRMTIS